jgi:asparagine synthase (glutamine-hydrolysing)
MCGICGIIHFDKEPVLESPIRKMMQIMKHRGPDDDGAFLENNVGFGFVRLSIIDLSESGHQPMFSTDGRYVIVYNGEIYNYIELRNELVNEGIVFKTQSDTEVLLNAYILWGEDCLYRFDGMWAIAIYDRVERKVFSARDRFGIKPYYYLQTGKFFAFASEISPLLSLLPSKPTADFQSIFDYLVFNRTDQTDHTFFNEIRKLQHGSKLTINTGRSEYNGDPLTLIPDSQYLIPDLQSTIKKWYDLKEEVSKTKGFKDDLEFRELLSSAVGFRLRSDVPVGVCLSGGLDSSSIVSVLLHNYDKKDLNTFSAVYNNGQTGDETEFINEFKPLLKNMFYTTPDADSLEKDLRHFIRAHEEPIPDTSPYAQFKVMEAAKDKVVVTLDGQGADEALAGYHYFFGFFFRDLLKKVRLVTLIIEMIYYVRNHHSFFGIKSFLYFMLPEKLRTRVRIKNKGYLNSAFLKRFSDQVSVAGNIYSSNSLPEGLIDHFEFKLEHLLKWEDRNSMCFSLEARVPFLDYRLVEKTLATSSDLLIKKGMTKNILRESMRGILPEKIRLRKDKIGFETPETEWFCKPSWQKIITSLLTSESFKDRNLIDPEKAMMQYQQHLSGKINVSKEIWKWIHLELWFREFID